MRDINVEGMCQQTIKDIIYIIKKHEDIDGENCSGGTMVGLILQDILSGEFDKDDLTDKPKRPCLMNRGLYEIYEKFYHKS